MTGHLVSCTCLNFRGDHDHEAERVAALVAQGYDQLTASRIVWCPELLDPTIRYRRRVEHECSLGRAFVGSLLDGLCRRWGLPTWRVETGHIEDRFALVMWSACMAALFLLLACAGWAR